MTDKAREAANAYNRERRREIRGSMTDEAKDSHNEYYRNWRKKNKDKVREYNARYWEKKAALRASKIQGEAEAWQKLYFVGEIIADIDDLKEYLKATELSPANVSQLKRELSTVEREISTIKSWF